MFTSNVYKRFLKSEIEKFINENGKLPTKTDMENAGVTVQPIIAIYNGWKNVLFELGILDEEGKCIENILDKIREIRDEIQSIPSLTILKEHNIDCKLLFKKYSWEEVKEILRNEAPHLRPKVFTKRSNYIDKKAISDEIIEFTRENEKVPTMKDIENDKKFQELNFGHKEMVAIFGSWTQAKEELDLKNVALSKTTEKIKEDYKHKCTRPTKKYLIEKLNINIKSILARHKTMDNYWDSIGVPKFNENKIVSLVKETAKKEIVTKCVLKNIDVPINSFLKDKKMKWDEFAEDIGLNNIQDDVIVQQIKDLSESIDNTPTLKEIKEKHIRVSRLFNDTVKGWRALRAKIGLPKRSRYSYSILNMLKEKVHDLKGVLNRNPKLSEAQKAVKIDLGEKTVGISPLINVYGGWNNLLYNLNMITYRNKEEKVDMYLNKVKSYYDRHRVAPTLNDLKKINVPVNALRKNFGSLAKAYNKIGIVPKRLLLNDFNVEETFNKLVDLVKNNNGKMVTQNEAKKHDIKTYGLVKHFEGWRKVKTAVLEAVNTNEDSSLNIA